MGDILACLRWLFSDRGMAQRGEGIVFYGFMTLLIVAGDIALALLFWPGLLLAAPITFVVVLALWHEVTD